MQRFITPDFISKENEAIGYLFDVLKKLLNEKTSALVYDSNDNFLSQKQKTQDDTSHPSDSLSILAEIAIIQIHHYSDESTSSYHMAKECHAPLC